MQPPNSRRFAVPRWVGLPKLVAAVSNAGGLGILTGLTAGSPENLRESIRETKKLTNKPL